MVAQGDGQPREWMTLAQCAERLQLDVEKVRRLCIAYENGDRNGLPSSDFSSDGATRKTRRVHVEDWREFTARRRRGERQQERDVCRALEVVPPEYPSRAERKAAAAAARGRKQL
jgi:hypothetical protein